MRRGSSRRPTTRSSTTGTASGISSAPEGGILAGRARAGPGTGAPSGSSVASNREPSVTVPSNEASDEAALRARIAELEGREAEHERAERVQAALYRIAEAASAAQDLQAFYREVHETVATLMFAENFYIALYDEARQALNYPYYADTVDTDIPDPQTWFPFGVSHARGVTAYVLRTGRPEIITSARHHAIVTPGEIAVLDLVGAGAATGA